MGKETDDAPIELLAYAFRFPELKKAYVEPVGLIADILKEVVQFIPKFRAVFNPHDVSELHNDYDLLNAAISAGKAGKCKPTPMSSVMSLLTP